jgi:hypothetical protein
MTPSAWEGGGGDRSAASVLATPHPEMGEGDKDDRRDPV